MRIKHFLTHLFKKSPKRSIAFISFHKCATSFFSSFVLKQIKELEHVDYANQLYSAKKPIENIVEKTGKVYGVIRILDDKHPSFNFVSSFLSTPALDDIEIIFWTRDPRDILVSQYYSFGFSHPLSTVSSIKAYQEKRRKSIQNMTLDEYVLSEAPILREKFELMQKMIETKEDYILLSYEEMINDFEAFFHKLSQIIPLDKSVKDEIYKETRPQNKECTDKHKRSGSTGTYKKKLKPATIEKLNKEFSTILYFFNYEEI